jgi:cytochrome P450
MIDSVEFVYPDRRSADVYNASVAADPQPFYRRLRDECPVALVDGMESGVHIVSRYDDVRFVLRHPEIFSSDFVAVDIGQDRPLIPLQIDPPEHAHYRRVMDPHLTVKQLTQLELDARVLVNEVIDRFIDRGECDFHAEFSMPLPCMIFLSLTGLPLEELSRFLTWKDNIIRPDTMDMDEAASIRKQTGAEIYEFFERAIDARADGQMNDIISRFMRTEVDGRTMSRDEMLDLCYLFILGGLDTVTATLDCSIAYLAQHPDHRREVVEDPSLVPAAVEEMLRTQTPVMQVLRVVVQPHEMHDVKMEPGDHVLVMLGSADTDPTEFGDEADLVDLHRESNRHLAFGGGPHRCLGSHLARLELRIALEELHKRIPDYRLAAGAELEYSPGIREIKSLPLVFS